MAARLGNVTFDCHDVLKLAAFSSALLGRPGNEFCVAAKSFTGW
jgi:hypothetical protein